MTDSFTTQNAFQIVRLEEKWREWREDGESGKQTLHVQGFVLFPWKYFCTLKNNFFDRKRETIILWQNNSKGMGMGVGELQSILTITWDWAERRDLGLYHHIPWSLEFYTKAQDISKTSSYWIHNALLGEPIPCLVGCAMYHQWHFPSLPSLKSVEVK